jgi:hypothetical protein
VNPPLPALDPTPLPAPVWLFHLLLLVTFLVHVLFMNVSLGGALIASVHGLLARGATAPGRRLVRWMAGMLPASLSFTITTGVAPLLFVQVLYAPLFYSATVLVGWVWLALLLLLVVSYYAVYLQKHGVGSPFPGWLGLAALGFVSVAGIQVLVNVLQLTPLRWLAVATHAASPLADPTMLPRYLHFLLGASAVAGVFLANLGAERAAKDPDSYYPWLARVGVRWALAATALQVADGFWLFFRLPGPLQARLMGGGPGETALLVTGMGLGLVLLILLSRIQDPVRERGLLRTAGVVLILTLLGMVLLRDVVRGLYLVPFIRIHDLPVRAQIDLLLLFLVVFVLGLSAVAWMLRVAAREAGNV